MGMRVVFDKIVTLRNRGLPSLFYIFEEIAGQLFVAPVNN
jgi:hypothetical protein